MATVCWMADEPVPAGGVYAIKHTTRSARAVVEQILNRIDVYSLHRDENVRQLGLNDIARVRLERACRRSSTSTGATGTPAASS